jgi:hypothetical protein
MNPDPNEVLLQESIGTLERLAFMFAYPDEERQTAGPGPVVAACVSFAGPVSGQLALQMSAAALPELTANMLGLEPDEAIDASQQHDALRETVNVICGNLLPALFGPSSVFSIGAPQVLAADAPGCPAGGTPVATARLALDTGWCDLQLYTGSEVDVDRDG